MILLDTHIWIWLVDQNPRLTTRHQEYLRKQESQGLGGSVISCWEVAKLVEVGRLAFSLPVEEWIEQALNYPGIQLLEFTPALRLSLHNFPVLFTVIQPIKSLLPLREFWQFLFLPLTKR